MADETKTERPLWLPDTQGFLAVAIIALIALIVLVLLTAPPAIDERTSGVLMTIVGVLIACLKDVYSFFFGSSKGSQTKDESQAKVIDKLTPPPTGTGNGALEGESMKAAVAAAAMAAPAAAAVAAPAAAAIAAPPAADIAAPPVVEAEVAEVVPREVAKQVAAAVAASKEVEKQK